jgi:hypothetical protein
MTAPALVTAASVREYMGLNASSSDSRYSDSTIGSNIRAAGAFLERHTGRYIGDQTLTLKFTTEQRAWVPIPGLRTATSVTLNGTALVADSGYYLIPDMQQTGVYTGIQFRPFITREASPWWLGHSDWFDRGLDLRNPMTGTGYTRSVPNDLVIAGSWGYTDAIMPEDARHAAKVLAGYITKRPDALLSGGVATDSGTFDLSQYPIEVSDFIHQYGASSFVQGVG